MPIINPNNTQLPVVLKDQLVERGTSIVEVRRQEVKPHLGLNFSGISFTTASAHINCQDQTLKKKNCFNLHFIYMNFLYQCHT